MLKLELNQADTDKKLEKIHHNPDMGLNFAGNAES